MQNINMEALNQRVKNLENLAWSLFCALETYITVSELEVWMNEGQETNK